MQSNEQIIEHHIDKLDWSMSPRNLYEPIYYIISQGGKRIRPQLCLLSADLFSGDKNQAIYPAIAFELLHNFTLIHDDIMDNANLRRGKDTVFKKWNTNIAILSGDALFAKSYEYLLNYQGKHLPELVSLLTKTAIEICEGQQLDLDFEQKKDVEISQYLNMIRLKTSVMLAGCLKAGAIVSNTDENQQQLIYDFGIKTGLAFQIQDDMLDVYANQTKFGKYTGGDIAENKKTYMLLKVIEVAQGKDLEILNYYLSSTDFDRQEKFSAVKSIYDKYEIKQQALELINKYYKDAVYILEQIPAKQEASKQTIIDFVNKLINRDY